MQFGIYIYISMVYNLCKLDKLTLLVNDSFLFPLKTGQYNLYQRVRTDIIYNFYNVNDDRIRKPKAQRLQKSKKRVVICTFALL